MTENWRPYPADPRYQVSDHGRVKGLRGQLLSLPITEGYRRVTVGGKAIGVHVMVLESFVGPRPDGLIACHWDDVKTNNLLTNLRWGTYSDNQVDSVRNLRHTETKKTHCPLNHELAGPNLIIRSGSTRRKCRACHGASNAISQSRRRGYDKSDEFEARAHANYERIMSDVER